MKLTIGLQRFAEQPKYTEVNPGQDALLVCKVIDKRGVCSWQKDNKPVGIYPKKYEWASQYGIGQTAHVGGDCSLWVRAAQLEFDDGLWECQVTASDFTTQDALTSQPVRLVVRVPPQRPRLEHEGVHVPPGHNVTVDSGAVATVKCVSHYGNPPAQLKWFLGDQEISPIHPQTNSTEPDNPRTWSAASVVQIPASKERHGIVLKCLALHESYAARSVAVEARLDVKYAPTVRLIGAPQIDLEEGKDSLILRCVADANPPASIVWRRAGRSEIASLQESLQLRPVGRRDAGLYTCQAQNSVGTSDTMSVQLDIKYAPKILSAGPDRLTTAPLFSPAAFECLAEGNPTPTYKWVQRISTPGKPFLDRGRESRLVIDNVTYDYQGEYECRATNFINGQERTATSDSIALQVVGAPQVLRTTSTTGGVAGHSVSVRKGDSATLSLIVCADPRPRHVAWEWGSLRLEAGSGIGRYRVDDVTQDSREDCYLATLHIDDADLQDQRPYYLVVENERGTDRHAISLRVEGMFSAVEPLELSYLLGIAGGCLAAFLILICLCIYAVRARKCCFRNRNNYKTSEKDSEKADLKSRSDSTSVPPLDSIYTTPTGFHHHHHHPHHAAHHPHQNGTPGSPEAMKTPNSETDCGTVKESLTDDASTAGTSPLQEGETGCGGGQPVSSPSGQPELSEVGGSGSTTTATATATATAPSSQRSDKESAVEEGDRCVREDSPSVRSTGRRSHDRTQGHSRASGSSRLEQAHGPNGDTKSEQQQQPKARLPAKASDYGLERFNRLLNRLDRGNFLIKTSFKKSYSLILMSARGSVPTGGDFSAPDGGDAARDESKQAGGNGSSVSNSSNSTTTGATSSGTSGRAASFKRAQQQPHGRAGIAPMGGSLRGWYPRSRGILIKANSSTGIYQLAGEGRTGSATLERMEHANTTALPTTDGPAVPVPGRTEASTDADHRTPNGHNCNGNSLTPNDPTLGDGEKDRSASNNESDELCRSEVFDNDSGSGSGGRSELNNRVPPSTGSPRKPTGNYENIRPVGDHRHRLGSMDGGGHHTLAGSASSYRKQYGGRKKSNAASTGSEWDEDESKLSSSLPHTSSEYYWQSADTTAVPTRFFQRQDYLQPALDFPPDRSTRTKLDVERARRRTHTKRRWLGGGKRAKAPSNVPDESGKESGSDLPSTTFHLPALFGGGSDHSGKRPPQLKNINLHFPNKTSHQQQHQQQHELSTGRTPVVGGASNPTLPTGYQQLALPIATPRNERRYFSKAKSHFLRLGQKWRLLSASGPGKHRAHPHQHPHQHQLVSSYNLDDLIKATHRYGQENESANLSQKIVYKSYKSELDLTKNLAYLDTFLNERFDGVQEQEPARDRQRTLGRGGYSRHKRAKSCSKALDPCLKVPNGGRSDLDDPGTTNGTVRTSANLIQLEDVWDGGRGQWLTTNTSSTSSSEYLRNNLSTTGPTDARKMRDFFRLDGSSTTAGREHDDDDEAGEDEEDEEEEATLDDDDDARMLLFDSLASFSGVQAPVGPVPTTRAGHPLPLVEHYGKNNATSSSLSSSDYASVYSSATSSGGNGAQGNVTALHAATQFKLLATPEEGDSASRSEYSPHRKQPRMNLLQPTGSNNASNPFMTQSATEAPKASSHRIYNNFLDESPQALSVPGSPAEGLQVEKNHRLRKPYGGGAGPTRVPPLAGSISPRSGAAYRVQQQQQQQQKPSNSRSHFRQMALDTGDLTYHQEDYLQHYQNAARARSRHGAVGSIEAEMHCSSSSSSFRHHPGYRHRSPGDTAGCNGVEDLRPNNALANENSDNDSDSDRGRGEALVKTLASDDVVTADELLLLVNAAIDIRRSHAVGDGTRGGIKNALLAGNRLSSNEPLSDGESATANEGSTALLAYKPTAGDERRAGTGGRRRAFPGINQPTGSGPVASKPGTALSGSYLNYGPHRVIVSQSRKERGEVVLEYEC
uniref:Ig-like domain-containing protein n=1 Tax=Anopheles farauti TaxID=69004 RepID=A0A182QVU9_9DIPT